jgi:hypothetical protein
VAIGGGAGALTDSITSGGSGGGGAPALTGGSGTPGQGESHNHMWLTPACSCSFMP